MHDSTQSRAPESTERLAKGDRWLSDLSRELEGEHGSRTTESSRHRSRHHSTHKHDSRHADDTREATRKHTTSHRNSSSHSQDHSKKRPRHSDAGESKSSRHGKLHAASESSEEGEWVESSSVSAYTPSNRGPLKGPSLPTIEDMQLLNAELSNRALDDIRSARTHRSKIEEEKQTGAIENLLQDNRRDAGVRDKKAENRVLKNESRKEFVRAHSPGGIEEIGDNDLYGGDGGNGKLSEIALRKAEKERIKRERKEAFHREKDAERRSRWEEMQAREQETIKMLKELARQRFGDVK